MHNASSVDVILWRAITRGAEFLVGSALGGRFDQQSVYAWTTILHVDGAAL